LRLFDIEIASEPLALHAMRYPQMTWRAPSKEVLEKGFEQLAPTLKKYTEFVPVVQEYPPTMEYVIGLYQQLIKAASK